MKEAAKKGAEEIEKAGIKAAGAALGPEGAVAGKVVAEVPFFRKILEGGLLTVALGILGVIALIIIGIIALISVLGPLGFGNRPSLGGNPYDSPFDCNVEYPANANEQAMATYIDSIIPSGSPLRGLGKNFVSTAKAGNKNPLFIAHFAQKESSWGTAGIARGVEVNGATVPTHNPFGRKAGSNQPSAGGWYKFSSWEEAVNLQGPYLKGRYQDKGLKSIDKIISTYCPPFNSEGKPECDTQAYIAETRSFISSHSQKANGAFGADPCTVTGIAAGPGGPGSLIMTWPIPGRHKINSRFGMRKFRGKMEMHRGVDISAERGDNIVAAADGVVEKTFVNESINGYGVRLDHLNGIKTAYLHFIPGSTTVQAGQSVKAGQVIGRANSTGKSTGDHLHFAVMVSGQFVDPCGKFISC